MVRSNIIREKNPTSVSPFFVPAIYVRTLLHLKPQQVMHRLFCYLPFMKERRYNRVKLKSHLRWSPLQTRVLFRSYPWFDPDSIADGRIQFLNVPDELETEIDWKPSNKSRLWRYNLHYFQYLHPKGGMTPRDGIALMHRWIQDNPPGTEDAWDPFPISLRLVNWIKYLCGATDLSDHEWKEVTASMYQQATWLEYSLERHLLANHFFKNLKALVFAGFFFEGNDAERWLAKSCRLLIGEIAEQILPDGGHFERSPMYHAMILEDCLDIINLYKAETPSIYEELKAVISSRCPSMVNFLTGMTHPDKNIALFNDSAFGIELPPNEIYQYAASLLTRQTQRPGEKFRSFPDSGYYVISPTKADRMIIDCGPVGPDYQPGHAHCDTLSYELSLDGRRIVVDSGVYDYEDSAIRQYVRSTRAHNTVMVNGLEQSELWKAFRVGRRARPLYARIEQTGPRRFQFFGAHDGYSKILGNLIHQRFIVSDENGHWTIRDHIKGGLKRKHRVESFIHIHPDLEAVSRDVEIHLLDRKTGKRQARIRVADHIGVRFAKGWYCPEFGLKLENDVIVMSKTNELPFQMEYKILKG